MTEPQKKSVFWSTQPVGLASAQTTVDANAPQSGIIDLSVSTSSEPILLPDGLSWRDVSADDEEDVTRLESFLSHNYVTDRGGSFRLGYSQEFLSCFLREGEPGWSVSIVNETDDTIGYVAAVKRRVSLMGKKSQVIAEVNLLCVRQDKRGESLSPVLIKEITRRVNLSGIFVAIFTCGNRLPSKPFTSAKYYHKFLNVKVLNEIKFTNFSVDEISVAKRTWQHKHSIPRINGNVSRAHVLRTCSSKDIPEIEQLFSSESHLYVVAEAIDGRRLQDMLEKSYLQCFVVEELDIISRTRKIVGFVSVYDMDLIVLENGKIERRVPTSNIHYMAGTVSPAIGQLFTLLQRQGKCVVTAVAVASNMVMIRQERMMAGTGELFYHMYNYRLPIVQSYQVNYHVY